MSALNGADAALFHLLNAHLHPAWLDAVMMAATEGSNWNLLAALLFGWLVWRGGPEGRRGALILALAILFSDQLSAHLIKPLLGRIRPCRALVDAVVLGGCGEGLSFPSSHATNMFAAAVVMARLIPKRKLVWYALAMLVAISRIYVGAHYPFDVIAGAALGASVAWLLLRLDHVPNFGPSVIAFGASVARWFNHPLRLALLSGILLGISFPPFRIGWVASIAFVPLLIAIEREPGRWLRTSYAALVVMSALANYWVGGWQMNADPFLMMAGGFLVLLHPMFFLPPLWAYVALRRRVGRRALWAFPVLWVAFEYLHSIGDAAYPWLSLGNTQTYYLEGIQWISFTGVLGLSFLLAAENAALAALWLGISRGEWRPGDVRSRAVLTFFILAVALPALHGAAVLRDRDADERALPRVRVAVVQPNIDPWVKWNGPVSTQVQWLEELTRRGLGDRPDLILWPETALPYNITAASHADDLRALHAFVDSCGVPLLTGFPDLILHPSPEEAPPDAKRTPDGRLTYTEFNSSMLLRPGVESIQIYHKMQLVPFGERTPYLDALPFIGKAIRWGVGISNWNVGRDTTLFSIPFRGDSLKIYGMICFESVFPWLVRIFTDRGADILSVITNDGWYGRSPGPIQHQQYASLRAIENRRAVARSANTGISCFVDAYGFTDAKTPLFEPAVETRELVIHHERTFYVDHGDLLAIACVWASGVLVIVLVGWRVGGRREARGADGPRHSSGKEPRATARGPSTCEG